MYDERITFFQGINFKKKYKESKTNSLQNPFPPSHLQYIPGCVHHMWVPCGVCLQHHGWAGGAAAHWERWAVRGGNGWDTGGIGHVTKEVDKNAISCSTSVVRYGGEKKKEKNALSAAD